MVEFEWVLELLWKGVVGGVFGFAARRILEGSQRRLDQLREMPPTSTDRDQEELLADYLDSVAAEIDDTSQITVKKSVRIIKSRGDVFVIYFYLKVQRLYSTGSNPENPPKGGSKAAYPRKRIK